jgi:hypothetical protein
MTTEQSAFAEVAGNVDLKSAYSHSFGMLGDKTCYQNASYGIDMRNDFNSTLKAGIAKLKAQSTTSGGAGTAGYAMIPIYVDPKIVDITRKYTPLVELLPRVTNMGITADYNVITAKGGAFAAAEDAPLAETNTTYSRRSKAIKYLYAVGRVTGQSQAAQPAYMLAGFLPGSGATGPFSDQGASNAIQQEVLVKTRELRELEENLIINGNSTTSYTTSPNGTEFDGIVTLMSTTNQLDKSGAAISVDDVMTQAAVAFANGGRPNLGVTDGYTYNALLKAITQKIGYLVATEKVFWGFSTLVFNTIVGQIPIVPSMFMGYASGSRKLFLLDLSVVEMRVLQDVTYQEVAIVNDSKKFFLKLYETMIIRAPTFCAQIINIA